MLIEDICDHLHRNSLGRRTSQTVDGTRRQQTVVTGRHRLPYVCQKNENRKGQADSASAEDIGERHDDEVGETECDDGDASQQSQLIVVKVELGTQKREHRRNG